MNSEADVSRVEMLISRAIDDEATSSDWDDLEAIAALEPDVWRSLAAALRQRSALNTAVREQIEDACAVEIPQRSGGVMRRVWIRSGRLSGWAAAAVVALAWVGVVAGHRAPGGAGNAITAGFSPASAEQALQEYMKLGREEGRVVGELPIRMLQTRRAQRDGRYEVLYVRPLIERTYVHEMYQEGVDDAGQPAPVRIEPALFVTPDNL